MSTCERVCEALPGFVAGEPDEAGVGAHLEACAPCRAEQAALARDLGRLRAELAPLGPSSRLAAALLAPGRPAEAARTPPREPRPVSWTTALLALAGVVAAALILPHWLWRSPPASVPSPGGLALEPRGETEQGPTLVATPPPAIQIARARAANRPALKDPGETTAGGGMLVEACVYRDESASAAEAPRLAREFPAPLALPGAVHRWVYDDPGATAGRRTWSGADRPVRGVLLGREFLKSLRPDEPFLPGEVLKHAGKPLQLSARGELDVVLGSPDGSTVASVRARLDRDFQGGVWVPDALARALALHQFEIPGGASVVARQGPHEESEVVGARARVRLEIPALAYREILEAFCPSDGPDPSRADVALAFEGEAPLEGVADRGTLPLDYDGVSMAFTGGFVAPTRSGSRLSFSAPEGARLWLRLPQAGAPDAFLAPGSFDPGARTLRIERLTLPGSWPAGATATLARVWSGRTAVPSAEAVSLGTVAADGRLSLPRIAGEEGAGLRLRLVTREGKASWHDVAVDGEPVAAAEPPPPAPAAPPAAPVRAVAWTDVDARVAGGDAPLYLQVHVGAEGRLALRSTPGGKAPAWTEHGEWAIGGEPRAAMDGLKGLHVALAALLASGDAVPPMREEDGSSAARLLIDAEAAAPWRSVQWVVATAASPGLRIYHLAFLTAGPERSLDLDLPRDGRLSGDRAREAVTRVEVLLSRKGGGAGEIPFTRLKIRVRKTTRGFEEDEVVLPPAPRTLAFRIEVLPDSEYRTQGAAESPRARTGVWKGSAEEFHVFLEAEGKRWQAARQAGSAYVPSRPPYRVVPVRDPTRAGKAFAVVEEPEDPAERFDAGILAHVGVGKSAEGLPVTTFEVRPEHQAAFARWTGRNVGLPLAILLDGQYSTAPYINSPLGGSVEVTLGTASWDEARREAEALQAMLEAAARGADAQTSEDRSSPASGLDRFDLPPADAPSGLRAAAWQTIEASLRTRLADLPQERVAELKAPPPTGGGTPYADAVAVMSVLRRLGCSEILLEGAAAPLSSKDGGGWGFGR